MFKQNKYTKWYVSIIEKAKDRDISLIECCLERHHIIPECMHISRRRRGPPGTIEGKPNHPTNLVYLTIKEHFLCHWLLTKMVDSRYNRSMNYALYMMSRSSKYNIRLLRGWQITKAREAARIATIGRSLSEATKDKLRNAMLGRYTGSTQSKEHIQKRATALTGKIRSEEHKKNLSKSKTGKPSYIRTDDIKEKNRASRIGAAKGYRWWNDGANNTLNPVCPGPNWTPGRLNLRSTERL